MRKWIDIALPITLVMLSFLAATQSYAAEIFTITPTNNNTIQLPVSGSATLTYIVTNATSKAINNISIEPNDVTPGTPIVFSLANNTCNNISLQPGQTCRFGISMQGTGHAANVTLSPRVCGFSGAICSTTDANNRVTVTTTVGRYQFAYILNSGSNTVSSCIVDPASGNFRNCQNAGATGLVNPFGITFNAAGTLAYISNASIGSNAVILCNLNAATGIMSNCGIGGSGFNSPGGLALNPAGLIMYVTNYNAGVSQCTVSPSTGDLSACVSAGGSFDAPGSIILNSAGTFAYVTNNSGDNVSLCTIAPLTGAFSSCTPTGGTFTTPQGIAFNPTGTLMYITNANTVKKISPLISLCQVNAASGALSSCVDSGATGLAAAYSIALNASGSLAFIPDYFGNIVNVCSVNLTTGKLGNCMNTGATGIDNPSVVAIF